MTIIFGVVLFLLGLLGAETLVTSKLPASRKFMDALSKSQEVLGILGIVLGIIQMVRVLDMLPVLRYAPGQFLILAGSVFVMIGLGLIFGLEVVRRNLKDTNSMIFQKLEKFRLFSLRSQKNFGIAGIVLGLIIFLNWL